PLGPRSREHAESFVFWMGALHDLREAVTAWFTLQTGAAAPDAQQVVSQALASNLSRRVVPEVVPGPANKGMVFHLRPASLLGAMWLQFADAVTGNKTVKPCETCGQWFVVAPRQRRADAKYCRDACKSAAFRARKGK